jgi:N6-L-threonylcarbamoyladenine synthase
MMVLGIETSCDETSVAIVRGSHEVLANVVSSQIDKHAPYGGVIPELAAREHLQNIDSVVDQALADAGVELRDLTGIAVTHTPGLLPALLVGVNYARGLAAARDLPLVGVNHMAAHVYGALIDHPEVCGDANAFPLLAVIVSGGHTLLVKCSADGNCEIIGRTLDDAAGEALDKAARILQLGYPGGPVIDRLARKGDDQRFKFPFGLMPAGGRPLKKANRLNFSYSGVKTALLYHARERLPDRMDPELRGDSEPGASDDQTFFDTIASYQAAVLDVLVIKSMWAAADCGAKTIALCGGVACNSRLRARMAEAASEAGLRLVTAPPSYCTDNAAMIAGLGSQLLRAGISHNLDLDAIPRISGLGPFPVHHPEPVHA